MYTPNEKKIGGFYFFLNQIKYFLIKEKIFLYVLTKKNYDIFIKKLNFNNGIFKSNIPWVFFNRKINNSFKTVGYMGDARVNRGFNLLPELIDKLIKTSDNYKFIIQFKAVKMTR